MNWSPGSLQQLIDKNAGLVNAADLFQRLKTNIEFFVDLPPVAGHSPETTASLLSLWCLGTYFMPIWSAFGYVHFDAAFEDSGKSRAAAVLTDLAFWPVVLSGPSTIPEWRDTSHFRRTQLFNDVALEYLPANGRQLLYVGYKVAGAKVRLKTVGERSGWKGADVDVFAPRIFASVVADMDAMLRSRTHRIEMLRTGNEAIAHRDPQFTAWPESKDQVREAAHLRAFQNMQAVDARYRSSDMDLLTSRSAEIGGPLLTMASMVEEAGAKGLFTETASILKAMDKDSATERARNRGEVELVEAAWDCYCAGNSEPSSKDIAEQSGAKPVEIGSKLSAVAWAKFSRHVTGTAHYKIDSSKLVDEMDRLGIL